MSPKTIRTLSLSLPFIRAKAFATEGGIVVESFGHDVDKWCLWG
jgi:hypothetical protein